MKITKEQREAIITEANNKISNKREKEFEKYYKNCTIPSEVNELNDLLSKYRDLEHQTDEIAQKKNDLLIVWRRILNSNTSLKEYFPYYINCNSNSEDARKIYAEKSFNKEFPKPDVQHLLELELLRGVFDLDAFLKKF